MKMFILKYGIILALIGSMVSLFFVPGGNEGPELLGVDDPVVDSPQNHTHQTVHSGRFGLDDPIAMPSPEDCIALLRAREGRATPQAGTKKLLSLHEMATIPRNPHVLPGQRLYPGRSLNVMPEHQEPLLRLAQLRALERQTDALEALEWQLNQRPNQPQGFQWQPLPPVVESRPDPLEWFYRQRTERQLHDQQRQNELDRANLMNALSSIQSDLSDIAYQQRMQPLNESFERYQNWMQNYQDSLTNQTQQMWNDHYDNLSAFGP